MKKEPKMRAFDRRNFGSLYLRPMGLLLSLSACTSEGGGAAGSLTVLLESEDVIVSGLQPGEDVENIRDGWTVTFDKYLLAVGDIDLHLSSDEAVEAEAGDSFVVDLTQVPASGLELWQFDELEAGRWEFNYQTPGAAHGASRHDRVEDADFELMVESDWTYLVAGQLTQETGQSCPPASLATPGDETPNGNKSGENDCYDSPSISFSFGATVETAYGPCEIDEVPGVSIPAGGTQTVAITIHGDHIFFNGFPEGDEGGVRREAQWLADCDLDLDGVVTQEELEAITPAQLPTMADYQFGGAPLEPTNLYEYVRAQLKSQGHYQGEGECPIDGVEHAHEEDVDE